MADCDALSGGRPVPAAGRGAGARRSARAGVGPGRHRRGRRSAVGAVGATTTVGRTVVGVADGLSATRARAIGEGTVARGSAISAWLPIIYGCDKTCTYCIVPFSRGPERSRPFDDIVDEARALAAAGYPRGHAARPERELVRPRPGARGALRPRRRRALGGSPPRPPRPPRPRRAHPRHRRPAHGRRPAGHPAAPLRDVAPVGPVRPAHRGPRRLPERVRAPPPAGPVGRRPGPPPDGPPVHDRALRASASPASARRCPGSRSRPTSSSGSAARPRSSSGARWSCSRPSATTRSSPPPTRRDPGRRRRTSPTTSRPRSSAAGSTSCSRSRRGSGSSATRPGSDARSTSSSIR